MQARSRGLQRGETPSRESANDRTWKAPVLRPHPGTTFERDLGRNATPIRQPREFIRAENRIDPATDRAPRIKRQ